MASEKGHLGVVQALLDAGADKEVKDRVGGGIGSDHSLFQDVNPQYDGGIRSPARMCMKHHMMLRHIGQGGAGWVGASLAYPSVLQLTQQLMAAALI